jgi:hypothetical protein
MSDQADNLRRLVRAQRMWLEFRGDHPAGSGSPSSLSASKKGDRGHCGFGSQRYGRWVVQAARWAFHRVGRQSSFARAR